MGKANNFFNSCKRHKYITSGSLMAVGAVAFPFTYNATGNIWIILYLAAVFVPVILGMMDIVKFKWVLLWEAIVLFPVTLISMLLFGGFIISLFKKA